jgi:hypothetical protein
MDLAAFILFALGLGYLISPFIALFKIHNLRQRVEELEKKLASPTPTPPLFQPIPATPPPVPVEPEPLLIEAQPPPLPIPHPPTPEPISPPPIPVSQPPPAPVPNRLSLEQFVGVKLFAWIGGLALFFGIVFFVKYAFERDLIPPAVRIAAGYTTAAVLMAAGYWFRQRQAYRVLTQTLSATGILAFYGVTYAAHAWYQFPAFTTAFTFFLMALITAVAFITAIRAKAEVVAVLGLAGGFLTPALVSSGQDQPLILFSYIALLNLGLAALAWRENWWRLLPLGAIGTVLVTWGWRLKFFTSSGYATGINSWGMVAVFGGFALFFSLLAFLSKRRDATIEFPWWSALLVSASALMLAFDFLSHRSICQRPFLLYTLVLLASVGWLTTGWFARRFFIATLAGSLGVMLHIALWMTHWLTPDLLPHALGINLLFGLLHIALLIKLLQQGVPMQGFIPGLITLLMMILMGVPLVVLDNITWMLWPPFLIAGAAALLVAAWSRLPWIGLAAITLTLAALLRWLYLLPHVPGSLTEFVIVLALALLVFAGGASLLQHRQTFASDATPGLQLIQCGSLTLPFVVLAMIPQLIPLPNPTLLWSTALALSLAAVALSRKIPLMTLSAWLGWIVVVFAWHQNRGFTQTDALIISWKIAVPTLALGLLWIMRKSYGENPAPTAAVGLLTTASLALLHPTIDAHWPVWTQGLLPFAFALSWIALTRRLIHDHAALALRACAGGFAVWFVTLIFPFQFDREWLTLAWALEAAALCWLFTRLPHDGLRLAGFGLATVAFARVFLDLNLNYDTLPLQLPMALWLLISFGLCATAMLFAALQLKPPHHRWDGLPIRAILFTFAGILYFALVNLQIANAFTPAGTRYLTLNFDGDFARDMSYSIAWGLFALLLLIIGFWKNTAGARYAAVGLLLVTLAKLFLHDLDQVGSIYRIGAFMAVAIIALGASFLYQRAGRKTDPTSNTTPSDPPPPSP